MRILHTNKNNIAFVTSCDQCHKTYYSRANLKRSGKLIWVVQGCSS